MANPPSYEESASEYGNNLDSDSKTDPKAPQHFSIREEVSTSRSQHVATLVSKLLPQIRDRARNGLSRSILMLLPSNQDSSRKGQLVGFPEDELPILIQLEGRQDTLEFWTQQEALDQLRSQMLAAISDNVSPSIPESLPERPPPPPATKSSSSSLFGRKQSKASKVSPEPQPVRPSASVEVLLDEAHFRSETEYGLYETLRSRCVLMTVDVR